MMPNVEINAGEFGPDVAHLLSTDRLPELGPGSPVEGVRPSLESLSPQQLTQFPGVSSPLHARCCLAGLWLWFDFLDESHEISQAISDSSGSYWHGIMHRREPDYSNAKYWYRRVGDHPVFESLAEFVDTMDREDDVVHGLRGGRWDPNRFVDLCEQYDGSGSQEELSCRILASVEWKLLFRHPV